MTESNEQPEAVAQPVTTDASQAKDSVGVSPADAVGEDRKDSSPAGRAEASYEGAVPRDNDPKDEEN